MRSQTESSPGNQATVPASGDGVAASGMGPEPPAPQIGDRIGRYVVLGVLGHGGMGVVLAAYDPQLDRKVALKLVRPGRRGDSGEIEREARMIAGLRHPNLVTVHDVGTTTHGVFLAMEFVDGKTLREHQRGVESWRETVALYVQAARGLAAVHDGGIVHGDFKPDNVLVEQTRDRLEIKLLDFGLAHAGDRRAAQTDPERAGRSPVGTLAYMAPEQFHGEASTPAADQFAFCVALFEALDGERPYAWSSAAAVQPEPTPLRWRAGRDVPGWLRAAIARGLSIPSQARWPSMHALAAELEAGPARSRRRVAASAGLLAVLGATAISLTRPEPCIDADLAVRAVWSEQAATDAAASLGRVLEDPAARRHAVDRVAAHAAALGAAARKGCQARRRGDTLLEARRDRCIARGIADLEVWAESFAAADPRRASAAVIDVTAWAPELRCEDDAALLLEPDPPDEQLDPGAVAGFLRRLARGRQSPEPEAIVQAEDEAEALVAELRDFGDAVLLAEAQRLWAQLATRGGEHDRGYERYLEALRSAEASGATRLQVEVWRGIAENRHFAPDGAGIERLAVERAAAAAERLGSPAALWSQITTARAKVALRAGDLAAVDGLLVEAIALAEASESPRGVFLALALHVVTLLRLDRVDEAVAAAERLEALASSLYGPGHLDTGTARGNLGTALLAASRFDEADARIRQALTILDRWGRFGEHTASAAACNWCHGVGTACRTEDTVVACTECARRVLRTKNPSGSVFSGLSTAMAWLDVVRPTAAAPIAREIVDRGAPSSAWILPTALAARAMIDLDPERALATAVDLCAAHGVDHCGAHANYVIARLDPDSQRGEASRTALLAAWREASPGDRAEILPAGVLLAESGGIERAEVAAARAAADHDCATAFATVDAWLAAPLPGR